MPLRAETRLRSEYALRGIVMLALAVMLWHSLRDPSEATKRAIANRGIDITRLTEWSEVPSTAGIEVQLERFPSPIERVWLAALRGVGRDVSWGGELPSLMVAARRIASPAGGTDVLVASPAAFHVAISADDAPIDTVSGQGAGSRLNIGLAARYVTAGVNGSMVSAAQLDSSLLRKLLVIGKPGWESKFVVTALEENGWEVDAHIRVAPGIDVTQGSRALIDTSRYSAVIALDGAATQYADRLIEFVRTGGGIVISSEAASLDVFARLRAGAIGRAPAESRLSHPAPAPDLESLSLQPIASLRNDAVPLDVRSGAVVIAARRMHHGRVLQIGYEDTWRWRMGGGDGALRGHRQWWTQMVSSVAHSPRTPLSKPAGPTDDAPLIGIVAAIGPATAPEIMSRPTRPATDWKSRLFVLLALGILAEIASRRLRGAM